MTEEKKKTPKRKIEEGTTQLLIWNFPIELKAKLKAKCARINQSMQDTVIDVISKFCE